MEEGLSLFGLPAGQEMQRAERSLFLPCCIATWRRSGRSSALPYPPPDNLILAPWFFYAKKWSRFRIQSGSVFDINFNLNNLSTGLVFNVKLVSFSLAKNTWVAGSGGGPQAT